MSLYFILHYASSSQIVGGGAAEPGEFPHQVALLAGGVSLLCGGSLVSDNKVITAGHCCDG